MIKKKAIFKKRTRLFILFLFAIGYALLTYFLTASEQISLGDKIYISFLFVAVESVFSGFFISEIINNHILINYNFKYKKSPQIFEFLFFLFLFLATLFVAYMGLYNNPTSVDNVLTFIQYNWLWILSYSFAIVFGYYHYFLRVDCA